MYQAEDLLDLVNFRALQKELKARGSESSVVELRAGGSKSPIDKLRERVEDITGSMELIMANLEHFISQTRSLGLERGRKIYAPYRCPSTSLVKKSDVCGRAAEIEEITSVLLSNNNGQDDVTVFPIFGMAGIGKTTISQVVYNDDEVVKIFKKRAWVYVSDTFDPFQITKSLLMGVASSSNKYDEGDDLNVLQIKLKKSLEGEMFLIVLDDVWSENFNDWDKLVAPLRYAKKGSMIIVTTRNENVANMIGNRQGIQLGPMSTEDGWTLFQKHALSCVAPVGFPEKIVAELNRIGVELVEMCKGLPLAVKTLGGLLRSKVEVKAWDAIRRRKLWKTFEDKSTDVLLILFRSYCRLPLHLKQCFAFCAVFPKNYHFDEDELVLLWIASGLLQHQIRVDQRIRDVGHECFSELISRGFFQKVSHDKYGMHDLTSDLAQFVSGSFCVKGEDYRHGHIPTEALHFAFMCTTYDESEKFKYLAESKGLRTFLPLDGKRKRHKMDDKFLSDVLCKLVRLRVLSLCGYEIDELPDSIRKLKLLRLLNLSSTDICHLPESICRLYNLQTLLLSDCRNLHKLPMDLTNLVHLHHVDLRGNDMKEMPRHLGRLKNLEVLTCFVVGESPGGGIEELEKLHLRGFLKITDLQKATNATDVDKAFLRDIEELVLQWRKSTNDKQTDKGILDNLRPHTNLKCLTIKGYGGTIFPDWLASYSFCNITSMCLKDCSNCISLPAFGRLPSLKSLTICGLRVIEKVGQEFYGEGSLNKPFQSLVTLIFKQMPQWVEWYIPETVDFPCLEELEISNCPKLKGELPPQLLSLTEFTIKGCTDLKFSENCEESSPNSNELRKPLTVNVLNVRGLEVFSLPLGKQNLSWLCHLNIVGCCDLLSFPEGGLQAPKLESLHVSCCQKLSSLPEQMHSGLPSLKHLDLSGCGGLESFPEGGLPSKLEILHINFCKNLVRSRKPWSLQGLTALTELQISHGGEVSFPDKLLLPSSLKNLHIREYDKLETLGTEGLRHLTSLEALSISVCENLRSLPKEGLLGLSSLRELSIRSCLKFHSLPKDGIPASFRTLYVDCCPALSEHLGQNLREYHLTKVVVPVNAPECYRRYPQEDFNM